MVCSHGFNVSKQEPEIDEMETDSSAASLPTLICARKREFVC
jgi:hypothetical protein